MIIPLLASLALQTTEPPTTEEAPPLVELAPAKPAPPPPPPPPPPPAASPSRVVPAADPPGNDATATTFIQLGAGAGACCVGSCVALPLALVPVAGPALYNTAVGAGIGVTEGLVGDAVGRKEGGLVPAILVGAGVSLAGYGGALAYSLLVPTTASNSWLVTSIDDPQSGQRLDVRVGGPEVITAVATLATIVVPALVYQLTSVEKP